MTQAEISGNEERTRAVAFRIGYSAARVAAIAASSAALLLCALLAPIQSRIWNGDETPGWVAVLASSLAPSTAISPGAAAMSQPPEIYFSWGRPVVLVYLLLLAALYLRPLPAPRWGRRALAVMLGVAAIGDYLAYWLSEAFGPGLRAIGFWRLEVPSLAAMLLLASFIGIRALRSGAAPRAVGWSLALCTPAALVVTAMIRYMPHALLLPLAVAMTLNAASTATRSRRASSEARHVVLQSAAAILVVALLLVAAWLPYRPVIASGDAVPAGPYAASAVAGVPGLRLHVFNTGANRMSPLLVGARHPWRPAPAFVIEHPTEGLVVFDTGLSVEVARDGEAALGVPMRWLFASRGRVGRTLDAQMREAGLAPERVRWVIVSHLHADHLGTAAAFAGATFVGGSGASAHRFDDGFAPTWRSLNFEAAPALPPFDAAVDLFGDGSVRLLQGGGHTEEDLMALLALPSGPVLLAGDAVVHREWLWDDDVQRIAVDPARAARVRNQVRALVAASPALALFPGHDLSELPPAREDLLLHHAEWFDVAAWPIDAEG